MKITDNVYYFNNSIYGLYYAHQPSIKLIFNRFMLSHNIIRNQIHCMNPRVSKLSRHAFNFFRSCVKFKTAEPPQSFGYVQLKKKQTTAQSQVSVWYKIRLCQWGGLSVQPLYIFFLT